MIRITIELLPGGYQDPARRPIGMMHIGNITDLADRSDYDITLMEAANPLIQSPPRMTNFILRNHDRNSSVWMLVRAALADFESADWEVL